MIRFIRTIKKPRYPTANNHCSPGDQLGDEHEQQAIDTIRDKSSEARQQTANLGTRNDKLKSYLSPGSTMTEDNLGLKEKRQLLTQLKKIPGDKRPRSNIPLMRQNMQQMRVLNRFLGHQQCLQTRFNLLKSQDD